MKTRFTSALFLICFCLVLALPAAGDDYAGIPEGACGVYTWGGWRGNESNMRELLPNVRGLPIVMKWRQLEPEDGVYLFDEDLGNLLRNASEGDFYTFLMVWVGPACPEWLYEKGVPEVFTDRTVNALGQPTDDNLYPYYFDAIYKEHFFRLIGKLGDYVNALPDELRKRITYIQSAEGSTGDGQPYKGKALDKQYDIGREDWGRFRIETWKVLKRHFQDGAKRPIPLLVNNDANKGAEIEWLLKNQRVIATKQGMFSHGYHISDGKRRLDEWLEVCATAAALGKGTFTRGEMDAELNVMGWSSRNVPQALYWSALYALHCGLDHWNVPYKACKVDENQPAFIFFNKYAGKRDAATANSAFCALRQGLDAADTDAFPEEEFGKAKKQNIERYLKIAGSFASYGAYQGDPPKACGGGMLNRKRDDYNDAGWGILAGNYERFLSQIEPDETSVGWWHKGPPDHIYSRFARGFERRSGKTVMSFRLDPNFFANLKAAHDVRVRIVYLDEGNGSWALKYHVGKGERLAATVQCKNTGLWTEKELLLRDAVFNKRLPKGADLMLEHIKGDDMVFHLVEIGKI